MSMELIDVGTNPLVSADKFPDFPCSKRGPGTRGHLGVQRGDSPDGITEGAFLPSAGAGSLSAFLSLRRISKEVFTF